MAIRNIISYKTSCITMANLMTSWTNCQSNWLDAPCVKPSTLCRLQIHQAKTARRTAAATKYVSTMTTSCFQLFNTLQWVGQLVHQPVSSIDVPQGWHHCCPLGTKVCYPFGHILRMALCLYCGCHHFVHRLRSVLLNTWKSLSCLLSVSCSLASGQD